MIDEEISRIVASRAGLPLGFVVKEFYLMHLLREMSRIGRLKDLVFKGGTALNKVYIKEGYRFSEDLDFDSAGINKPAEYLDALENNIRGFDDVERRYLARAKAYQMDFKYGIGERPDKVRLDINFAVRIKTAEDIMHVAVPSRFTDNVVENVPVYAFEDLVARKMRALRDRASGKDIFDVYKAVDMADKNVLVSAVRRVLEAYSEDETAAAFFDEITQRLKHTDWKKVRNLTNPFIPVANRPTDWSMVIRTLQEEIAGLKDLA